VPHAVDRLATHARATFVRYYLASAALLLVVVVASLAQSAHAQREYIASQQLQVVALSGGGDTADPTSDVAAVARTLATPAVLSSPRMADDVLARLPVSLHAQASVTALQGAFAGSASGAMIMLSATWTSAQGARDLLGAGVSALQSDAALFPTSVANRTIRIQPLGNPSPATQSTTQADAIDQALIQRILMGLLAAAALPFVLDALLGSHPVAQGAAAAAD